MSYFDDLVYGGRTGTDDPSAAGLDPRSQPFTDPMSGMPMQSTGGAPQDTGLAALLRRIYGGTPGMPQGDPQTYQPAFSPAPAPPPIPGAPGPQMTGGDPTGAKRTLAILANGPTNPASGYGINLVGGEQTGPYADLRKQMAAQPPPSAPAAQPAPRAAPSLNAQPAAGGSGIQGQINELKANPDFQRWQPASVKPDFHDNLLRFGLAAMAAGGKPGATTLGALGEAGVSTFDANWKAKQSDIENALAGRKVGIQAQGQISLAYERLDKIRQLQMDHTLSLATQTQLAQEKMQLLQMIAADRAAGRADTLDLGRENLAERQRANNLADATRTDNAATNAAKAAETLQNHATTSYDRKYNELAKQYPMTGIPEEKTVQLLRETARDHPTSTYAREWEGSKAEQLDNARRFIAANPALRQKAIDKLRSLGINAREL